MKTFFLGVSNPAWFDRVDFPIFVSHTRLRERKSFRRSNSRWSLDSGGFTQLSTHGKWLWGPREYADAVRRYMDGVGNMEWASIQDWMCEPIITQKTGKTIKEHQSLSVQSYLDLVSIAPEIPWAPVLQGQSTDTYIEHIGMYVDAGVNLWSAPACGVGSVCRRQAMDEAVEIFRRLHDEWGLKNLHGFGVKKQGLRRAHQYLKSADSMAWSFAGRMLDGKSANSLEFATKWRNDVVSSIGWA